MTTADLADGAPSIEIADVVPTMPRGPSVQDRVLPIFIIASLIVHATAILPSLLRHETEKAAAPKEIAVEVVQEAPKPKPPPPKPQQTAKEPPKAQAPKQEVAKKEVTKQDVAKKQEPPKREASKPQPAKREAPRKEAARPTPKPPSNPEPKPQPKIESVADRFKQLIGPMPAIALPSNSPVGTEEVSYSQLVLSKLAKAKKEGRYQGIPGAASVSFTVGDNGEVVKVEIAHPSGDKSLDDEAIAMVKRGAPYPAPPPGGRRDYTITLRFQALI